METVTARLLALALLIGCGAGDAAAPPAALGPGAGEADVASRVGRPAPGWEASSWLNSPPLTVEGLRGKVVLVRWFMATECPYCSATAPALRALHDDYADRGLVVVGMYHHKSDGALDLAEVRALVEQDYRFEFPVAIDDDWRTLRRWWLDDHPDSWTSVSFLLDRAGVVRAVHLGGEYPPGSADEAALRRWIERLLSAG
jgi:thiol-disulfide isomerase/thioredoxin